MFQSGIQDRLLDRVLRLKTLFGFGQLIYFLAGQLIAPSACSQHGDKMTI